MIKKVLLINPPNTILADSVRRISEPLSLLYLGAMLQKKGLEPQIFDMACEGYDQIVREGERVTYGSSSQELIERLSDFKPDLVGVTCMFTSREPNTGKVCDTIRGHAPDLPIVVGGLHPSIYPERFVEQGWADFVIIGEGERRILQLIDCLEKNRLPDFDGIAFKDSGVVKFLPPTTKIEDLDDIPIPDRSMVDMERYFEIDTPFAPFAAEPRVGQILATRGCPFDCNFCSSVQFWGRKVRTRSVDNILAEIKDLVDNYGVSEIQFVDDNLTAKRSFAKELFIQLKEFGIRFCTPNGLYLDSLDDEIIGLMAESGAYQLTFAVESASKRVLKEIIHKNVPLDRIKSLVDSAHRHDISVHGMFLVGSIGETKEEIMRTMDFPFTVGFDSASFFIVNPLPGSPLYDECLSKGYLGENYSALDFKTPNIHIPTTSPDYTIDPSELEALVEQKTNEYNEWAKQEFPKRHARKFKRFLEKRPDQSKLIQGRVT
ncbi:MAG: B12-binding domain-containing radical SAM protein [Magnetococcales bacterium]|nr:B12-binding domain-containing radical SAM protein [Magnetococcales bacterium]